jgi:hypothetical protein
MMRKHHVNSRRWNGGWIALVLVVVMVPGLSVPEETVGSPNWAAGLGLFVFGGPASASVDVRVNGQTVAEIAQGSGGGTHEIEDALQAGVNEFAVEFHSSDAPQEDARRLTVSLATSQIKEDGKRRLDESVAETSLPPQPPASTCTETYRFWAGPPPESRDELKKRYFMAIHGPPVGYLVTILLNDSPVYTTTRGERLIEVTAFIVKGQNRILFEAVPDCFDEAVAVEGQLEIFIAAARMDGEDFRWEGGVLGEFDLRQEKNREPLTRRQSFRAR